MPQKKIRTCKTCAERFEAKRSDAKFCSDLHRVYYHQNQIPKAIQKRAEELRAQRNEQTRKQRAKRKAAKANRDAHRSITEMARELYLEVYTKGWNDQITEVQCAVTREEMIRIRDAGIEKIKAAPSVPDQFRKMVGER